MMNEIKGVLRASDKKFAIIISRFNSRITEDLLEGAIECIERHEGSMKNIDIIWVPGAFEIPSTASQIAKKELHDAIICLGAVIRGETSHFDYVAGNAASGVSQVGISSNIPVIFGILTVDTLEQAFNRSGVKHGNAGYDAAMSAIDMISVYTQIDSLE